MSFIIQYKGTEADRGMPPVDENLYEEGQSATIMNGGTLERDGFTFNGWRLRDYTNFDGQIEPLKEDWNEGDNLEFLEQTAYVVDGDGNEYTTVVIGNQEWTVENWRSTKYADGTDIPLVTAGGAWGGLSTPAYCWYNNTTDAELREKYGALYNWFVVDPANTKNIAPDGWRVPTQSDFETLRDYMVANGFNWDGTVEGNKVGKALASSGSEWDPSGTVGHVGNDQTSNNSSGFNGLPGGFRNRVTGVFELFGAWGFFWTITDVGSGKKYYWRIGAARTDLSFADHFVRTGFSIRLVRDI